MRTCYTCVLFNACTIIRVHYLIRIHFANALFNACTLCKCRTKCAYVMHVYQLIWVLYAWALTRILYTCALFNECTLWGGFKEVINFPWIFYAMRSLVPVGHFRDISGHLFNWLVCGSFQWRHGLLFADCIVWDDKDKVIGFKRSHWIHLGRWSSGSPKLQLLQLSEHSYVTNCRLISSSAYFPWNMTLKYKTKLSEGSWDKILHSKSRTLFFEGRIFFWRFVCRSDTPKFRK